MAIRSRAYALYVHGPRWNPQQLSDAPRSTTVALVTPDVKHKSQMSNTIYKNISTTVTKSESNKINWTLSNQLFR